MNDSTDAIPNLKALANEALGDTQPVQAGRSVMLQQIMENKASSRWLNELLDAPDSLAEIENRAIAAQRMAEYERKVRSTQPDTTIDALDEQANTLRSIATIMSTASGTNRTDLKKELLQGITDLAQAHKTELSKSPLR